MDINRLIERIKKWINDKKEKCVATNHMKLQRNTTYLLQVKEYGGEIWFVYNHDLICPMSFFENKDIVDCLRDIRKSYIEMIEIENKWKK